ncbi:bifunctional PIG-L family deacetylase/class I SAM-dependent methyltransferase [Nocardioides anomalus]|uniref:Bifunctional PIG-L family deacetylase/class I SAM-dependent methyltransferase n=1 Tax=Nocardioides anomalus TaxID=2712223 RepID=A0A6G6WDC9_9ACTN|nr:bifunctional PIG-L family deacetylase/class I SAM-dependent methyltransferase [Nocardioides anomalus]QIG43351.1 bifunctional PIG-L family deacetylase/class I SAM-dependent methyltransferase [Nocardioides anomalus]
MVSFTHDGPGTAASTWAARLDAATLPALDLGDVDRVVVVAAHPDDESLGAGGLLARASARGLESVVVVATDGEASHPDSTTHTASRLAELRRAEVERALARLHAGARLVALALPDGRLADHQSALTTTLVELIGDGRRSLVVAPWRRDGHPDHEAAGRAAAAAAVRTAARLWEYPVWWWHWATPEDAPWSDLAVLALDAAEVAAKAAAGDAHASQVHPLSDRPGDEVLLSAEFRAHFEGDRELFVLQPAEDSALDDLHAEADDPWGVDVDFYEERKRGLLLAALPRERFRHGLEVGSSTGALAADLAARCDALLVVDASAHAVAAAQRRCAGLPGVRVEQRRVPAAWPQAPAGGFDLVVLSEVGYFLSPRDLDELLARIGESLAEDGVLVLCDWQHEVQGWPLDGVAVHRVVRAAGIRPVVATYADRDVELLVLAHPEVLPEPQADDGSHDG